MTSCIRLRLCCISPHSVLQTTSIECSHYNLLRSKSNTQGSANAIVPQCGQECTPRSGPSAEGVTGAVAPVTSQVQPASGLALGRESPVQLCTAQWGSLNGRRNTP